MEIVRARMLDLYLTLFIYLFIYFVEISFGPYTQSSDVNDFVSNLKDVLCHVCWCHWYKCVPCVVSVFGRTRFCDGIVLIHIQVLCVLV